MTQTKYTQLSELEHILKRPGMYIGNITNTKDILFTYNDSKIEEKSIEWNYGIYKIFDEIIVNSVDESLRNSNLNKIDIVLERDYFQIKDNGGIRVELQEGTKIYIPEFLFAVLRTSSNYDDTEDKEVTGLNGLGGKISNIYAKKFIVDTCLNGKRYYQTFSNNNRKKTKHKITKSNDSGTTITVYPDFEKFGLENITDDNYNVLIRRIYDLAGLNPHIDFSLNGNKVNLSSFIDYCHLFDIEEDTFYFTNNDKWNFGLSISNNGFKQVSFANSSFTRLGGTHVEYLIDQVISYLRPFILKKHKLDIKPSEFKHLMFVFVSATVKNNRFASQTKEELITDSKKFGNLFILDENFLSQLKKSEIVNRIIDWKKQKDDILQKAEIRSLEKNLKKINLPNLIECSSKKIHEKSINIFEGFCLDGDTEIKIINVSGICLENRKIKDIKRNDLVISHKGKMRYVNAVSKVEKKKVVIELNNENLICSEDHKWYVFNKEKSIFEFIKTKKLIKEKHKLMRFSQINENVQKINRDLITSYKQEEIDTITFTDETITMYDIEVEIDHSFVLSNGIISHNSASNGAMKHRNPKTQVIFPPSVSISLIINTLPYLKSVISFDVIDNPRAEIRLLIDSFLRIFCMFILRTLTGFPFNKNIACVLGFLCFIAPLDAELWLIIPLLNTKL
jgi:DNA gyrase/topoisomerase IV subunit B